MYFLIYSQCLIWPSDNIDATSSEDTPEAIAQGESLREAEDRQEKNIEKQRLQIALKNQLEFDVYSVTLDDDEEKQSKDKNEEDDSTFDDLSDTQEHESYSIFIPPEATNEFTPAAHDK